MGLDLSRRHDLWLARVPTSPQDEGRVEALVVRPPGAPGERRSVERIELTEDGVVGDKWVDDDEAPDGTQVSIMNTHMARAVAGDRADLIGDNLRVDLDLSEANLPVGTKLEVGTAVLVVSEVPHRPCKSFHDRFGAKAAKRIARSNRTGKRGRGVLCRVARPGVVSVGDVMRVVRGA